MSDHTRHHRRRTTQIPSQGAHSIHDRLPRLFSGHSPAANKFSDDSAAIESSSSGDDNDDDDHRDSNNPQRHSTGSSFLASAARTYSRAMYAHTTSQISSPGTGTLPSYNRIMHDFTLNQLNHMDNTGSHNPANLKKRDEQQKQDQEQPQKTLPIPIPPAPTSSHIPLTSTSNLKLPPSSTLKEEEPCGPSNTPVGPAPISKSTTTSSALSSADPLAQARQLEARFGELMEGPSMDGQMGGGLQAEVRDFAAVGLV